MFSKIKTIFFDLDNTLFDHRRSETETLKQLMHIHRNSFNGIPDKQLFETYDKYNTMLWREMANGQITPDELKIKRFRLTMDELGIKNLDCEQLSKQYMQIYSAQRFVISGAHEILAYLKPKYYLGILSNGFTNTQETKLSNLGINSFFWYKIFSEEVGALKPSPMIFSAAEKIANARPDELVYVGDSYETDIMGAKAANWNAIFFNPSQQTYPIKCADAEIFKLNALKEIF